MAWVELLLMGSRSSRFVKLLSACALMLTIAPGQHAQAIDRETIGTSDPKDDIVVPLAGSRIPGLPYSFSSADILSWSLTVDREEQVLVAEMTMNGPWYYWIEQPAWGTFPLNAITFTSPSLPEKCDDCDERFGPRRFMIGFGANGCPGDPLTVFVGVWDPITKAPETFLVLNKPKHVVSQDQKTVTITVPYSAKRAGLEPTGPVASTGDRLGDISAVAMIRNGQGGFSSNFCLIAYAEEGMADWSPHLAWEPTLRNLKPTAFSLVA